MFTGQIDGGIAPSVYSTREPFFPTPPCVHLHRRYRPRTCWLPLCQQRRPPGILFFRCSIASPTAMLFTLRQDASPHSTQNSLPVLRPQLTGWAFPAHYVKRPSGRTDRHQRVLKSIHFTCGNSCKLNDVTNRKTFRFHSSCIFKMRFFLRHRDLCCHITLAVLKHPVATD